MSYGKAAAYLCEQGLPARIKRFEAECDGAALHCFAGREEQFARLDAWLADERADPRLLISAPSGRGKTTLLVKWLKTLKDRSAGSGGNWRVVFAPISLRLGSNAPEVYYRLLADQIADAASKSLDAPTSDPAQFYFAQSRKFVERLVEKGERALIVLDGADEALDGVSLARLFPLDLPATLRVVVSASPLSGGESWRKRLGWPLPRRGQGAEFELPPLSPAQIGKVFMAMGAPASAVNNDTVVRRLAELTGGEPLLLRLYAEDLWGDAKAGASVTAGDLSALSPGFGPYLQRWLDLQEQRRRSSGRAFYRDALAATLAVLGFAKGPLEGRDLLELLAETAPEVDVPLAAEDLLWPVRRFVVGDGSRLSPYLLKHSKFGEHFRQAEPDERAGGVVRSFFRWRLNGQGVNKDAGRVSRGFVRWARRHVEVLNGGALEPGDASPYALRYAARHFEDAAAPASDFVALTRDGWRRAWEHMEGGPYGFSADVRIAWTALRRDGQLAHLGAQLRCVLILSSFNSLSHGMPETLIAEVVKRKILSARQGQFIANVMADTDEGVEIFARLASLASSDPAICRELVARALEETLAHPYQTVKAYQIDTLLKKLFGDSRLPAELEQEVLERVQSEAYALTEPGAQARALIALAPHLPEDRRRDACAQALDSVRANCGDNEHVIDKERSDFLTGLAPHLPDDSLAPAFDLAKGVKGESERAKALAALAARLPNELLPNALAAATGFTHESLRCDVLVALAPRLRGELLGQGVAAAQSVTNPVMRCKILTALASAQPEDKRADIIDAALAAARAITHGWSLSRLLPALVPLLPESRRNLTLTQALDAARAVDMAGQRSEALTTIALLLPEDQQRAVLDETFRTTMATTKDFLRYPALIKLAPLLPAPQLAEAFENVKAIRLVSGLSLAGFAPYLPPELLAEAVEAAAARESGWHRAECLAAFAPHAPDALLAVILQAVRGVNDGAARAIALAAIASRLPGPERPDVCAEALAAANSAADPWERCIALTVVASSLPKDERLEVIVAALDACEVVHHELRESAHETLTQLLPAETLASVDVAAVKLEDFRSWFLAAYASSPRTHSQRCIAEERPMGVVARIRIAGTIEERRGNPDAANILAFRPLSGYSGAELVAGLLEVIPGLKRDEALDAVTALLPHIAAQGGVAAVRELRNVIGDVGRWCP